MTEQAAPGARPVPVASDSPDLWLVRHGETEWSKSGRHTGRTEIPLTPLGERQARVLGALLAELQPVLILTSPRERAWRTVELAGLADRAPVEIDPDLAEWDYGEYEGLTTPEIRDERPGWTIWTGDPPGGESADEVCARADRVLARIRKALERGPVLTVGHGHFSRVLAARWLGLPPSGGRMFVLGPASPCVLSAEHGHPAVHRWNVPNPAEPEPG